MKHAPKALYFLSGAMLAVAVGFPLQVVLIYGFDWTQFTAIFNKVSNLNFLIMAFCLASVPLILRGSRWMLAPLLALAFLIAWNNLIVGMYAVDFSLFTATLATALFLSVEALVLHPKVTEVLRYPQRRWWLTPVRKKVHLPVSLNVLRGRSFELETFDLSETGLFIPSGDRVFSDADVRPGDPVDLRLSLGSLHSVQCQAQVVRKTDGVNGKYPNGLGLKFTGLGRSERVALRRYLDAQL